MDTKIQRYKEQIEAELLEDILPFWIEKTIDKEHGGFYGLMTNNLVTDKQADKGCILNSRILWTFSAAYRMYKKEEYLQTANVAYDFLVKYFWDKEKSGLYWMTDYKGNVISDRKQFYNLSFGIYGLAEYNRATGNQQALNYAIELFKDIEQFGVDKENRGYFEAVTRDWQPIEDLRLSEKDMNEKKSMNTHLHILEAYTNLYRVWKDESMKNALKELIDIMTEFIMDENYHYQLFFDEKWNIRSEAISFGHDIEGSWLLYEAATVLGDKDVIEKVKNIAIKMADGVLAEGMDHTYGGMYNEAEHGELSDTDKPWWAQAEAMVGFVNAYELTKDEKYLTTAMDIWEFIKKYLLDKEYGEWFWKVRADGSVIEDLYKVEPWKCPYHAGRACMELVERIEKLG